ncbi:hypothetical protein Poli38472_011982 [Pythium oligandrum]|uniref:VPS9 domain-containing protein n=1 Tax=Pythium oligandrum TaxID=41045 RepID=A0A8K1CQJ5_PYTOL|nr:hypothetical protein Poli38472_011982 [Pythium oligandrum]|eukprot:TMW66866.1 hypothetical protein Poli38472_011982 [Pythium oligandrum]
MAPYVNLSSFLEESRHWCADALHGHSFHRVALSELSAVQHSRLFFRDCLVCEQRVLSVGKTTRKRKSPVIRGSPCLFPPPPSVATAKGDVIKTSGLERKGSRGSETLSAKSGVEVICQCLDCGNYVHRECLSDVHAHRRCRGHDMLIPQCPQATRKTQQEKKRSASVSVAAPVLFPPPDPIIKRVASVKRKYSSNTTIASLIEELSEDGGRKDKAKKTKPTAANVARRIAPFLAAGGVIGAIALGPAAGVLAGLNMLIAGVGVESMVAGLGITAATAAATATHQIKKKQEKKKLREEMKSGAWAMQICWKCKQSFQGTQSDELFRKDAELLRRFQLPRRPAVMPEESSTDQFAPSKDDIYALLFGVFSASSEFLTQVNVELGKAFMERFEGRNRGTSAYVKAKWCKETLQDAKMYVAHLTGVTMQIIPSLSSTDDAIVCCSQAVERLVFDDIYKTVIGTVDVMFADENLVFNASLNEIRARDQSITQLITEALGDSASSLMGDHLQQAERKMIEMMDVATSPLHKLELLCSAFRSICCFADQLHQTASNADILIPIVCAVLISSKQFTTKEYSELRAERGGNFVSQIAFISFFTEGGGKGVEGYVLTTFQAAIQVIAAVDLTKGPAKELELFPTPRSTDDEDSNDDDEAYAAEDEDDESEQFFDARTRP